MIPASYHFRNIYRRAWVHPGVEAEIVAAQRRDGIRSGTRPRTLAAWLGRLIPALRPRRDWSRVPAE